MAGLPKLPQGWFYQCSDGKHLLDDQGNLYAQEKPTPAPVQVRESSPPAKPAVKAPSKPASVPTPKPKPKPRPRSVAPSPSAVGYLRAECNWLKAQPIEHTVLFSLDEVVQVCGCTRLQGTSNRCAVDVGHVVKEALAHAAVSVVTLHNHPSKTVAEPSADDDTATDALREALEAQGIGLFDHFVVAQHHIHSYRESAMEPESLDDQRERESQRLWARYGGRPSYA